MSLRDRILDAAKKEPSPSRAQTMQRRAMFAMATLLVSAAALASLGVSPLPRSFLVQCAVGWGAIALVATAAALARTKTMLGLPTRALALAATFAAPLVFAWAMAILEIEDAGTPAPPIKAHFVCFVMALALAALPLAFFLFVRRRSDPVHPRATGAAIGAAAGAWGGLLVHLHCPFANPAHMLFGHVLPIVALAIAVALVSERILGLPRD